MIASVKLDALKQGHWYEYLIRFLLGGLATVLAGLVAQLWGPELGGLFLAFPAVFCASVTLVERHERHRKTELGLRGERRGRGAAALDASGAALGGFGMAAFGFSIWLLAASPKWAMAVATSAWLAVCYLLWRLRHVR
jgi:hypothetical protein